jgi:pullulanase/glycogen debranching enzyme
MDVVYNHLNSSGPFGITSVLDKVINSNILFMSTATKRTSIAFFFQ